MSSPSRISVEYLVAQAQKNRVTYVNGAWRGSMDPKEEKAIDTCPQLWDFLNEVGAEGWSLTATQWIGATTGYQLLFLSRESTAESLEPGARD